MRKHNLRREDGQTLLLIMLVLPLLLALSALVVDGANGMVQRRSVQSIADAAALAAAQDLKISNGGICDASCVATLNKYVGDNGLNILLVDCSVRPTNCYVAPYKSHIGQIEVRLKKNVATFFGRAVGAVFSTGLLNFDVSARAVGAIANGPPPQLTFAALNSSAGCDSHTLVIRSSGHLTVNNKIYVNSCSGTPGNGKGDGFDIFGSAVPPGSVSAKDILTHGGWETHTGLSVIIPVGGPTCPLMMATTTAPPPPPPPGCPKVGQPLIVDPFADKLVPPPLDSPAITNTTCPCWAINPYAPPQILDDGDGSIDATQTSILVHGNQIGGTDWISIDGERMHVTHQAGGTSPPGAGRTLTVAGPPPAARIGQLGTTAAAHTAPSSIPLTAESCTGNEATMTTSVAHGLDVADWVKVSGAGAAFNGIYQVTKIPDDETAGPREFSYAGSCGNVGAWDVVRMSRTTGISTLTTSTAHNLNVGDIISVNLTGSDMSFNVDAEDGVTVQSVPSSTTFTYAQPGLPDVRGTPVDIKNVQRFEGTATIVTAQNHTLLDNHFATIINDPDDTSFNGHVQATVAANNKFTYSQVQTGQAQLPDVLPDKLNVGVSKVQRSGGTSTLTVGNVTGLVAGTTYVVVHVTNSCCTSFSGTFLVTAIDATNKTLSYSQSLPDVALTGVTAPSSYDGLVRVSSFSRTNNVATIVTSAAHGLTANKDTLVDLPSNTTFNGTFNVVSAPTATTFTYNDPGPNVPTTTSTNAADGVTGNLAAGGALDESGDGGTVLPDDAVTTGTVTGPAVNITGAGGTEIGPLFEIFEVTGGNPPNPLLGSTKAAPVEYAVPAGTTQVLNPGTYYGGICIGAATGAHCGPKVGGSCATSSVFAPATVTMNPGIYIMAGGGFYVCGNTTLNGTAGVMIYNTIDSAATSNLTAAALDQVMFNTNGAVNLAPLDAAPYSGMTIWQGADPANVAGGNQQMSTSKCDGRQLSLTDIALTHASNGLNGISGTIYAPAQYALFRDTVSGTATLAVITGCIFIDGATSTFNFDGSDDGELLGIGYALTQ